MVRLMSRSANPARALNRAPGRLWRAKTIEVLFASGFSGAYLAITQNRVMLSAKS